MSGHGCQSSKLSKARSEETCDGKVFGDWVISRYVGCPYVLWFSLRILQINWLIEIFWSYPPVSRCQADYIWSSGLAMLCNIWKKKFGTTPSDMQSSNRRKVCQAPEMAYINPTQFTAVTVTSPSISIQSKLNDKGDIGACHSSQLFIFLGHWIFHPLSYHLGFWAWDNIPYT